MRKEQLTKELEAVTVLLDSYEEEEVEDVPEPTTATIGTSKNIDDKFVVPKGKKSWEEYSIYLLEKLGGTAKATEVAELATKANPNLNKKTVQSAIKSKLSINFREGEIDAVTPNNKKEGYTYKVKQKMVRTRFPESSPE